MKKIFPAAALALLFFASAMVFVSCSSGSDDDDSSSSSAISEESTTVGFYLASEGDVLSDGKHYYHFTSATKGVRNRDATSTSTGDEKSFEYSSSTGLLNPDYDDFDEYIITYGEKIYLVNNRFANSGRSLFSTFTDGYSHGSSEYGEASMTLSSDGSLSGSIYDTGSDGSYHKKVISNGTFTNASGIISAKATVIITQKEYGEDKETETFPNVEWIMFYCGDYMYDVDEELTKQ